MTYTNHYPMRELFGDLRVVAKFASTDDARKTLTCVHLRVADDLVTIEATDMYRMARITAPISDGIGDVDALIPAGWLARWMPRKRGTKARFRTSERSTTITNQSDEWRATRRNYIPSEDRVRWPDNLDKLMALVPDDADDEVAGQERAFNPKYLGTLFEACHMFAPNKPARVRHLDVMKPLRFDVIDKGRKLTAMMMPVRIES